MKVGIVTIYNSQNCGSFLQALSLHRFVESLGYDAVVSKNNMYYKNRRMYRCLMASKYLLLGQHDKANCILKTHAGFKSARKKHLRISKSEKNDVCIYGSDTIWNIDSDYFGKEWKHYWGQRFAGKKIAYAPSIGPTKQKNILNNSNLCDCIKSFSALSVRDKNTHEVVSSVVGNDCDITYVVDPTMLMPKSFYEGIASDCDETNFILFYYFGKLDAAYMEEIKKYAKENGKKLICFGDNIKGADKQLCFNPLDMMAYYSKADLVITNTFHGNVFSVIFNKPFVNIDAGKAKVNDLLESFGLSKRTIKTADDFSVVASENINFDDVNVVLEQKKKASGEYLKNALKKCEEDIGNAR